MGVKGGEAEAFRVLDSLKAFRLSVGLEDAGDLIAVLKQALDRLI